MRYILNLNYIAPDDTVIDLVKGEISRCEKDNQSWIIQGFPRTKR